MLPSRNKQAGAIVGSHEVHLASLTSRNPIALPQPGSADHDARIHRPSTALPSFHHDGPICRRADGDSGVLEVKRTRRICPHCRQLGHTTGCPSEVAVSVALLESTRAERYGSRAHEEIVNVSQLISSYIAPESASSCAVYGSRSAQPPLALEHWQRAALRRPARILELKARTQLFRHRCQREYPSKPEVTTAQHEWMPFACATRGSPRLRATPNMQRARDPCCVAAHRRSGVKKRPNTHKE